MGPDQRAKRRAPRTEDRAAPAATLPRGRRRRRADDDDALPLDERALPALTLAARTPITALRWWGRGEPPLPLAPGQGRFTLGAGACDLIVPRALAVAVSARHAVLTRVHSGLRIEDCRTRNGTFRSLGSARLASFQIEAGERFWIGDVPVLSLDAALEALRPQLAACVGLERHEAVDEALALVADGRPIALLGPPGTDAARLARAIHAASAQRDNRFLAVAGDELPSLAEARGATVFVELERVRTVPAPQLRAWLDPTHSVRLIVAATDERRVRACLDTYRDRVQTIALCPLAQRPDEVARLIARHWRDELRSARRVEELGIAVAALGDYRWPRNLEELREHSPRLLAYLEHGGVRAAAAALGIAHQTLGDHFARIGFEPAPRGLVVVPGRPSHAREPSLWWRLVGWALYSNRSDENRYGGAASTANTSSTGPLAQ